MSASVAALALVVLLASISQHETARAAEPPLSGPASVVLERLNETRFAAGIAPLSPDVRLDTIATERSADMLARGYFSHARPEGGTVFDMLVERGIEHRQAAENLAWNTASAAESTTLALQTMLASPPHRAQMMSPAYRLVGIGWVSASGKHVLTLVFID